MNKEEREELDTKIELGRAEILAIDEEEKVLQAVTSDHFPQLVPARLHFIQLRRKYVRAVLKKLQDKDKAAKEYDEWERRTKA